MSKQRWPWPRIIAHRGGGTLAPENTLAAIRKGHALGFRGVEFDVMLAADAVPMLIHDETLERTTRGRGNVADRRADELAALDAGSWFGTEFAGEPIPQFDAAARLCLALGLWTNVEIKPATGHEDDTGRLAATLAAAVWHDAPIELSPLLSSFSERALEAARMAAPQLTRGLLFDGVPADWQARMRAHAAASLHCNQRKLDERSARAIADAGYGLAVWTVNDTATARRLFDWGVDAIFTDRLDLFTPEFH